MARMVAPNPRTLPDTLSRRRTGLSPSGLRRQDDTSWTNTLGTLGTGGTRGAERSVGLTVVR
ncbi:hypothetical protein OG500_03080 [Kitasatospora sp. NBC_01250]|uniref:hypothetical protein n=1 Tax=Kitasatospora sp. NBC_01250 TaxID=2903571 RepID=UPI002E354E08|nr:hypothetical protein [Kitasatospora sp. NBC_01250]